MKQSACCALSGVESTPSEATLQAALVCYQEARYDAAIAQAQALIKDYPQHVFGWKLLGAALHANRQFDQALQAQRESVRLAPLDSEASNNLAATLIECGRLEEASTFLKMTIAADATNASLYVNLGFVFSKQGLWQEAAQAYAFGLAPGDLNAQMAYAKSLHMLGQPLAIEHYRTAIELRLKQPSREIKQTKRSGFDAPFIEAVMWTALAQLAAAGVHAFPCSGTLLGLVREGKLLPFDKDVDFGLPLVEHAAARACLLANGWRANEFNFGLINPLNYIHHETGLTLDLCGFGIEPNTGITISGFWIKDAPEGWNRITEYSTLTMNQDHRPEGAVWMLAEPERYLDALYGDWRTPDPDFNTVIGAKNLRGFTLLTQCYALMHILDCWQKGALKKALFSARHYLRHLPDDALLQQVQAHLQSALSDTKIVDDQSGVAS